MILSPGAMRAPSVYTTYIGRSGGGGQNGPQDHELIGCRGARHPAPSSTRGVPVTDNRETELLASVPDGLFIGGEWRAAEGGKTQKV